MKKAQGSPKGFYVIQIEIGEDHMNRKIVLIIDEQQEILLTLRDAQMLASQIMTSVSNIRSKAN